MKALVIGGTGVIGSGVVKHLLARDADVTTYDRDRRGNPLPPRVRHVVGDRSDARAFEHTFEASRYDVVVDLVCFTPSDAESTTRAFAGRCEQVQFCSTVCVYGVTTPPGVLVDETCPLEPPTRYGRNKLEAERVFERAAARGDFASTIVRPSQTYGPGGALIDQLELDGATWDRVTRGLPVLCAGDGLGLWQATHRDDCGKAFAYAALNPNTYGEAYNATLDRVFTWRDYYREAARALDRTARVVFVPTRWLFEERPERFTFLRDTSRFDGAYSSAKAKRLVPEFRATIGFESGARETLADVRRRDAWRVAESDPDYDRLVARAIDLGFAVVDA